MSERAAPHLTDEDYGSLLDSLQDEPASELVAAPSVDLHRLLADFVDLYAGMRQRDGSWYKSMGVTVGGSEIAALMGMNPYSSFYKVVTSKIATLSGQKDWDGGGIACWWGSLFEDVVAGVVAADLGAPILGDEISIRDRPGHRNSPDGYVVATFYVGADGEPRIWTTERPRPAAGYQRIALLEFKCPLSRRPGPSVPRQYKPQLWSGLMVSPVASLAIFVDSVFRKCALGDLGATPEYDTAYHRRDADSRPWEAPFAWGVIAIYAPRLDAPLGVRMGWRGAEWAAGDPVAGDAPDAAQEAWRLHATYFGMRADYDHERAGVVDFGDAGAGVFEQMMGLVDRGVFKVRGRDRHRFADGRGNLPAGAVEAARRAPPAGYWLVGVLPWKLFESTYISVNREPGFEETAMPLIAEAHKIVSEAIASGDPPAYLAKVPRFAVAAHPADTGPPPPRLAAVEVQDFFDMLS
jgi:hypothetical protein